MNNVVPIKKDLKKWDIMHKDKIFNLDVVPRKYGCDVLYYFDGDENLGPFVINHRRIVKHRKVRLNWFDRFAGRTLESKVVSSVAFMKKELLRELERVSEVDDILNKLGYDDEN